MDGFMSPWKYPFWCKKIKGIISWLQKLKISFIGSYTKDAIFEKSIAQAYKNNAYPVYLSSKNPFILFYSLKTKINFFNDISSFCIP